MFRLLATTKCKRQQIAILIISFFAYVAGIHNEGNNMLLLQQQQQQQQQTAVENSNYERPITDIKQETTMNFRPSQVIDFIPADATIPQSSHIKAQQSTNNNVVIHNNNSNNNNIQQKQETQNFNRRYAIETAATYGNTAKKPFSFPNEQQQMPQHLTDKPIYIYRDPFTNENYHYTATETKVKDLIIPTTYNHNNYNNNAYKQQNTHQQLQHDDNQEYLVQSSMIVGAHQHQHQQQVSSPYMSLSADKDVYLKRPGFVYDEKPNYNHPNSVTDKKSDEVQTLKVNKISYDSHDYPPPSYFQQQTSNFLPTPVPAQHSTPRPTPSPTPPPRLDFRPTLQTHSTIFGKQRPQQQYLQSSQSMLPNYANSIDNYLLNKQQTSDYYHTEVPPPSYLQQQQQPQIQHQYESRPPYFEYNSRPQSSPALYARPPSFNFAQTSYPQYEMARPPPAKPSYNNYYDYQIGAIPPQNQLISPPSQQLHYPYDKPPPQYPYQMPYRPSPPPQQQYQSGLATLAQYAPQFTSLILNGIGGGSGVSNTNGPLGSLIGALTGAATSQQSTTSSSSYNRRPINSQLIKALENIARNDDLQCVPRVLCQMIAAQTQRGQLPTFITSPAITNFLAGFPAASSALIFGRAVLLGLSGGEKSCHESYGKCPKNEYEIIYYLNNHRGGFFKFFGEPEEPHQTVNKDSTQQRPTSLFSILAALAGTPQLTTTTPRPTLKPLPPSVDTTSGIGNFFTQLLSDYMGGATLEYQRRFKRRTKRYLDDKIKFEGENEENDRDAIKFQDESRESQSDVLKFKDKSYVYDEVSHQDNEEDFHDEEDEEDTQQGVGFKDGQQDYLDDSESRILQNNAVGEKRIHFFPDMIKETSDETEKDNEFKKIIKNFNDFNKEKKLKFPTAADERGYVDASFQNIRQSKTLTDDLTSNKQNYGYHFTNYVENSSDDFRKKTQQIKFIDSDEKQEQYLNSHYLKSSKAPKIRFVSPEREGKILNNPYYAASNLQEYLQQEQLEQEAEAAVKENNFFLSNTQRPLRYTELPTTSSADVYNTLVSSVQSQNSLSSNAVVNNNIYVASSPANINSNINHFLPTPSPSDNDYTAFDSIILRKDYNSNKHNVLKQSSYYNPQKYPSSISSTTTTFNVGTNKFDKLQRYTSNSQTNYNQYHSSLYTTRRPYISVATTKKSDDKNIYVTNSRGITEYYITPDDNLMPDELDDSMPMGIYETMRTQTSK